MSDGSPREALALAALCRRLHADGDSRLWPPHSHAVTAQEGLHHRRMLPNGCLSRNKQPKILCTALQKRNVVGDDDGQTRSLPNVVVRAVERRYQMLCAIAMVDVLRLRFSESMSKNVPFEYPPPAQHRTRYTPSAQSRP